MFPAKKSGHPMNSLFIMTIHNDDEVYSIIQISEIQ